MRSRIRTLRTRSKNKPLIFRSDPLELPTRALAFVQDRSRAFQVGGSQVLGLNADHVLPAEGGSHGLGEAPGRDQPVAAEQDQDHAAALQLLAQALLPALTSADVVLVVEQGPGRPRAPDTLADSC